MRFYLNVPLVTGYVLMATVACLGMLQLAAARDGYAGLALFVTERKRGTRLGIALTTGALSAYVLFAPEILTPGPAGSEVAGMFSLCALLALTITLVGADLRQSRQKKWEIEDGEPVHLDDLSATLFRPSSPSPDQRQGLTNSVSTRKPTVMLLPDPSGFVAAPKSFVEALCQAGIAVLFADPRRLVKSSTPFSRLTLLGHLSTALVELLQHPEIDEDHIAILGLGLSGNAVLRVAASDPKIRAAVAVSPITSPSTDEKSAGPGLQWLHELSYRQAWRWRCHSPKFQRAAAELGEFVQIQKATDISVAIVSASGSEVASRNNTATPAGIEVLSVPTEYHFSLLKDERALQQTVNWLKSKLLKDSPRSHATDANSEL